MSQQEMSHSQALQELTRFENVWKATAHLKEALRVAAGVENAVRALQDEEKRLQDVIQREEAKAQAAKEALQKEVAEAEAKATEEIQRWEQLSQQCQQEYEALRARKERETNTAISLLEQHMGKQRESMRKTLTALSKEISAKQAFMGELEEQLGNLRKRLE